MKSFLTAYEEIVAEDEGTKPEERYVEFEMGELDKDGKPVNVRTLRAYPPTDGQLAFMLAAMGRGQTQDQRFAAMINILLSSLRDEDADYMESRLLSRDPKVRLPLEQVQDIFEYLTGEWFARPTQSPSDSAPSLPSGGEISTPPTTN